MKRKVEEVQTLRPSPLEVRKVPVPFCAVKFFVFVRRLFVWSVVAELSPVSFVPTSALRYRGQVRLRPLFPSYSLFILIQLILSSGHPSGVVPKFDVVASGRQRAPVVSTPPTGPGAGMTCGTRSERSEVQYTSWVLFVSLLLYA